MLGQNMKAAAHKIIRKQPSRDIGIGKRDRHGISGCRKRFGNALVGVAVAAIAGDLPNLKDRQMHFIMLAGVANKLVGHLLGSSHARIGEEVSLEGLRKVYVENGA